ncbi:hypothetical protein RRG08_010973 [Elysia crispata]|uniref:Uncharacterized protein n=1 Tax=Elysia crispata TaxID=231223 RepID=A0AAE0XWT8_9GAST|nr:hypothetical protein RRG08_010973 [Elysia crispata]
MLIIDKPSARTVRKLKDRQLAPFGANDFTSIKSYGRDMTVTSPEWWCCGQPGAEAWSPLCISVCLAMYHDKLIIPLCVCVFSLQNGGVVGSPVLKPGLLSVSLYVLPCIMTS